MRVLILLLIALPAMAMKIEVFTQTPCPPVQALCYNVVAATLLMTQFNREIKQSHIQSPAAIKQMLDQKQIALKQAFKGRALAIGYGLTKTPAIVINGQAIVYGTTNPTIALKEYEKWHASLS